MDFNIMLAIMMGPKIPPCNPFMNQVCISFFLFDAPLLVYSGLDPKP